MDISRLCERVTLQKNEVTEDDAGNRMNAWQDIYSCAAYVQGEAGSETNEAAHTEDKAEMSVTVRWCSEAAGVTPGGYRLIFSGSIFDILSVDHLGYRNKEIKLKCRKAER